MKDKFLNLLFNPGEHICVSDSQFGYHSVSQTDLDNIALKSPNSNISDRIIDWSKVTLISINPIKGWRRDENVTSLRSFLIEIDDGTLDSQLKYAKEKEMPYSACVFSGNRSLHFVLTLDRDLPSRKIYDFYYKWALNIMFRADQQVKNPSRSIRVPGNLRPGYKKQALVELNDRITQDQLLAWLKKYPQCEPKVYEEKEKPTGKVGTFEKLNNWAKKDLAEGINFDNGRNNKWYSLSCEFALNGYSLDETIKILRNYFIAETDFTENEWKITITSAFKKFSDNI